MDKDTIILIKMAKKLIENNGQCEGVDGIRCWLCHLDHDNCLQPEANVEKSKKYLSRFTNEELLEYLL